jgi:hypothetical protein
VPAQIGGVIERFAIIDTQSSAVHVTKRRQPLDRLRHLASGSDNDRHVDDRFRSKTRDRGAADVFDPKRDIGEVWPDALTQQFEVTRPLQDGNPRR